MSSHENSKKRATFFPKTNSAIECLHSNCCLNRDWNDSAAHNQLIENKIDFIRWVCIGNKHVLFMVLILSSSTKTPIFIFSQWFHDMIARIPYNPGSHFELKLNCIQIEMWTFRTFVARSDEPPKLPFFYIRARQLHNKTARPRHSHINYTYMNVERTAFILFSPNIYTSVFTDSNDVAYDTRGVLLAVCMWREVLTLLLFVHTRNISSVCLLSLSPEQTWRACTAFKYQFEYLSRKRKKTKHRVPRDRRETTPLILEKFLSSVDTLISFIRKSKSMREQWTVKWINVMMMWIGVIMVSFFLSIFSLN